MKYLSSLIFFCYPLISKGTSFDIPKKILVFVFLIFVFTISSCGIFKPQSLQQQQTPPLDPSGCVADQDCTIVPKHSLCCEMDAIAILKSQESEHLKRECTYSPEVCALVSYQHLIARCINSQCIVKRINDSSSTSTCNQDSDCVLVRRDSPGLACCPNHEAFHKSEILPQEYRNPSIQNCRTLVACPRSEARCNNSRCVVKIIPALDPDF